MIEVRSLWSQATAILWVALRSFGATMLLFIAAGVGLSAISFYLLRENTLYAAIAALLTVLEATVVGVFVGGKRATGAALAHGVASAQIGRSVLRICFDRLLDVSKDDEFRHRGTSIARAAERIPLAEAETRLRRVVSALIQDSPTGGGLSGWFRRQLHRVLLRLVLTLTLAEFREEGTRQGGVDLVKAQAALEPTIDAFLVRKLRQGTALTLLAGLAVLFAVVALQTYGFMKLLPTL